MKEGECVYDDRAGALCAGDRGLPQHFGGRRAAVYFPIGAVAADPAARGRAWLSPVRPHAPRADADGSGRDVLPGGPAGRRAVAAALQRRQAGRTARALVDGSVVFREVGIVRSTPWGMFARGVIGITPGTGATFDTFGGRRALALVACETVENHRRVAVVVFHFDSN